MHKGVHDKWTFVNNIWIHTLFSSIPCIVFTLKCLFCQAQTFWQSKVGYWVKPFTIMYLDGDMVDDLQVDYIQKIIDAGFVILISMSQLQPVKLHGVGNVIFEHIHPGLGTMGDLDALMHAIKNRGRQNVA
ncbi:alpha-amylase [Echinococcus granulosus]|uniref:Alpha-amylase n=1 Tax=Echinococcus granulosus TaxID=6210 RepID=W6UZ10_ECHGR|nr:alpha-amylase [Echinococcus granulosus]XP_024350022.1 alpha-amylase [Echinococcus granulosus]EUB58824.1 alpha-amylase [Echinococcus granulosus]EUB58826.1 alpha-amylase [Echinococcus granulosus]